MEALRMAVGARLHLSGKAYVGRRFESAGVHLRFMPTTPDGPLQPDAALRANVSRRQTSGEPGDMSTREGYMVLHPRSTAAHVIRKQ